LVTIQPFEITFENPSSAPFFQRKAVKKMKSGRKEPLSLSGGGENAPPKSAGHSLYSQGNSTSAKQRQQTGVDQGKNKKIFV
jgi:hypothetical protein